MKLRNSDNTVTIVTEDMFENRVTHERLVHAIEIGQRSTYCHTDTPSPPDVWCKGQSIKLL